MTRKYLLILCVLLTAGCLNRRHHSSFHPHGMPPGQAKKVKHAHAGGCGHALVDGVWIVGKGHKD